MPRLYLPDLLLAHGSASSGRGLLVGDDGSVISQATPQTAPAATVVRLPGKALLPGLANAHSHTFQRLFRARAEGRRIGGDTFWTWREQMYRAAAFCSPDDLYDVARAAFLEMLASGITLVGEFHYLHNDPSGNAYADPNELAHQVIRAAQSVGIRICLLRTCYMRAGFQKDPHPGQRRFYETEDAYLRNLEALLASTAHLTHVTAGAAPHSIRAVPCRLSKTSPPSRRAGNSRCTRTSPSSPPKTKPASPSTATPPSPSQRSTASSPRAPRSSTPFISLSPNSSRSPPHAPRSAPAPPPSAI